MFSETGVFAAFKWNALLRDWQIFAEGFAYTLVIAFGALFLALILGIIFGTFSTSNLLLLKFISRFYVEVFQNTPLLIQVFLLFNGLPLLGVILNITTIGILGVGLYHGAYVSEVVRSGIGSIHKGQFEAALSQGFNYWEAMRYIILPQAQKIMLPPLTMQAVNLIKNTSVVAIISGADIMFTAKSWSASNIYYGPAFVTAGLLYFIICFPLATWAKKMEDNTGY